MLSSSNDLHGARSSKAKKGRARFGTLVSLAVCRWLWVKRKPQSTGFGLFLMICPFTNGFFFELQPGEKKREKQYVLQPSTSKYQEWEISRCGDRLVEGLQMNLCMERSSGLLWNSSSVSFWTLQRLIDSSTLESKMELMEVFFEFLWPFPLKFFVR